MRLIYKGISIHRTTAYIYLYLYIYAHSSLHWCWPLCVCVCVAFSSLSLSLRFSLKNFPSQIYYAFAVGSCGSVSCYTYITCASTQKIDHYRCIISKNLTIYSLTISACIAYGYKAKNKFKWDEKTKKMNYVQTRSIHPKQKSTIGFYIRNACTHITWIILYLI